jgi:hypothetical protein
MEQKLIGTWSGTQHYSGRAADITIEFKAGPRLQAHYNVVAPGEGTFSWVSTVEVKGDTVVTSFPGDSARTDTLTLSGNTLKGSYTFKGKPWGTIELRKR